MAEKIFAHDINLVALGQLVNARVQNVTQAQMTTLAGTLGASNTGLFVYNTTDKKNYTWDGVKFVADAIDVIGDLVFKGVITKGDQSTDPEVELVNGFQYAVSGLGAGVSEALVITGVTVFPAGAQIEDGDQVILASSLGTAVADQAYVVQRNDEQATEAVLGNVRLATQAEVTAGVDALEAITPATLAGALVANQYVKQYHGTVALTAGVAATVTHGLALADPKAFFVSTVDSTGNQVSVEVDAVDANSLTLTSLIALTGVVVTVAGASTTYVKGN